MTIKQIIALFKTSNRWLNKYVISLADTYVTCVISIYHDFYET